MSTGCKGHISSLLRAIHIITILVRVDDDCTVSLLPFAIDTLHHRVVVIIYDNIDDFIFGVLPLRDHVIGVYQDFLSVSFSGGVAERGFTEVISCYCSLFSSYIVFLLEHGSHTSL